MVGINKFAGFFSLIALATNPSAVNSNLCSSSFSRHLQVSLNFFVTLLFPLRSEWELLFMS